MENKTFKSVTFGGFDKKDVVDYIEQSSQEHASAIEKLQQDGEALRAEKEALFQQASAWKAQLDAQTAALEQLQGRQAQLESENAALPELRRTVERLTEELQSAQPDAEAYRAIKTRIGDMECAARKRAADLEASTNARLNKLVTDFRSKYQDLVTTFDSTSGYVTAELRKVEVNLTQLPRALDQMDADLKALDSVIKDQNKPEE